MASEFQGVASVEACRVVCRLLHPDCHFCLHDDDSDLCHVGAVNAAETDTNQGSVVAMNALVLEIIYGLLNHGIFFRIEMVSNKCISDAYVDVNQFVYHEDVLDDAGHYSAELEDTTFDWCLLFWIEEDSLSSIFSLKHFSGPWRPVLLSPSSLHPPKDSDSLQTQAADFTPFYQS